MAKSKGNRDEATLPALMLELPIGEPPTGYLSKDVSVSFTQRQAVAFAMLMDGLNKANERTENGHVGTVRARGLMWLLDRVADAYGI